MASARAIGWRSSPRTRSSYLLLYLGAAKAGAVTVPINYRLAPPEWRYILADSGARICFVGPEFVDGVNERRGDLATVEHALVVGGEPPAGWESYTDWTAAAPATAPDRRGTADHDAYQMYTSGTTGHPKGAVLTHRAVTANLVQIALACQGRPPSAASWSRRSSMRGRCRPRSAPFGGVGPWSSSSSSIRSRSCASSTKNASGSP